MSLWRLEWLRLTRTRRWIPLLGVFVLFGFVGPLSAYYLPDILMGANTKGLTIIAPKPTAFDGLTGFTGNALQLGIIVTIVVAVATFAFDAHPGLGIFYRSHVRRPASLVLPRFTVVAAATLVAWVIGILTTLYETEVLLGLPFAKLAVGTLLACLYLLVVVAASAAAAALARGVLAGAGLALGFAIAMPIAGSLTSTSRWLPSELSGAVDGIVSGTQVSTYVPSILISAASVVVLLGLAVATAGRREL